METATLGGGCFWCVEAVYQRISGVRRVMSGYAAGKQRNPTYEAVCTGRTGHAEVVQMEFDEKLLSYGDVLEVFWKAHDPTTLNRQGADVGTQYRSRPSSASWGCRRKERRTASTGVPAVPTWLSRPEPAHRASEPISSSASAARRRGCPPPAAPSAARR